MRRNVLLATGAVVLVLGLVLGAFALGKRSPQPQPADSPGTSATGALPKGRARASAPAQRTGPGGLPQGFDHSPDGAAAAAAAYDTYLRAAPPALPDLDAALAAATGAPSDPMLLEGLDFGRQAPGRLDFAAGAYAVEAHGPDRVTVHLWRPFSSEVGGTKWSWRSEEMLWLDGEWRQPKYGKIAQSEADRTYGDGPVPDNPSEPLTSAKRLELILKADDPRFPKKAVWQEWADA